MSARIPLRVVHAARALPRVTVIARAPVRWTSTEASSSKTPAATRPAPSSVTSPSVPPAATAKDKAPSDSKMDTKDKGKKKEKDSYVVPPLSRPLGVYEPPNSAEMTFARKKELMLDKERHRAKRQALIKEATQGYFHDYNVAKKANGGKLWVAPPVLIREDRALYFPDITGKALTGATTHTTDLFKDKISLVSLLNTRISEEHVQGFVEPVLEDWEATPHFRYIQINHQENLLKSMLLSFFVGSLKRTIPQNRWDSYLISSGQWSELDVVRPLSLENKLLGYVFLVDQNAKVRWAGCGGAWPEETENLRRAAAVLIRRMSGQSGPLEQPAEAEPTQQKA